MLPVLGSLRADKPDRLRLELAKIYLWAFLGPLFIVFCCFYLSL